MVDRHWLFRLSRLALLIGALAVFTLLVSFTALFRYLELKSYDILLRLNPRRPPARQVVVVGIDDRSIAALGRLPWNRKIIAGLIDRIQAAGGAPWEFPEECRCPADSKGEAWEEACPEWEGQRKRIRTGDGFVGFALVSFTDEIKIHGALFTCSIKPARARS